MGYDTSLIAPYNSGLKQYYKPFLIGNDAFTNLVNCYSWRGVVKKREGSNILARLPRWKVSTNITNASPPQVTAVGHGLIDGDMVWLENVLMVNGTVTNVASGLITVVTVSAAPGISLNETIILTGVTGISTANPLITFNNTPFTVIAISGNDITIEVTTTGTYSGGGTVLLGNLEKTAFSITEIDPNNFTLQILNASTTTNMVASGSSISADIYLPVIGTKIFISKTDGNEQLIVFSPKKAYLFNASTLVFDNISFNTATVAISWGGNKDNFFYTSNYANVMWATNNVFKTVDQPFGIRYYNGSTTNGWADHQPLVSGTAPGGFYLNSTLLIFPYKGRLVALNTTEGLINNTGNVNYQTRARWCQRGTPFVANPSSGYTADPNSWNSDIPGKGGFVDADTSEAIVSVEVIQDVAIVGFQFSTWRLRYTGNEILPFIWERIDTQFGSEATFSTIPFDDGTLQISRRGIIKAGFNSVARIDLDIPDFVDGFEVGPLVNSLNRIQGARDYQKRLVYWLYADQKNEAQTPDNILCYNYQDNTWSTFNQSFTCIGNYKMTTDNTWSTWTSPWSGDNTTWNTTLEQTNAIIIVAGSKDGNVWQLMQDYVGTDNGINYNFTITTNLINPYFSQGQRCKLAFYDLYLTNTDGGQITLKNYTDDDPSDPWLIKSVNTNDNSITSNSVKVSKYIRVFLGMIARQHQITLTLSDDQLNDASQGTSAFELQGIVFHTRKAGRLKM